MHAAFTKKIETEAQQEFSQKRAIQLENDRKDRESREQQLRKEREQQEQRYAQEREQQEHLAFVRRQEQENSREMSLKSQKMTITMTTRLRNPIKRKKTGVLATFDRNTVKL
ncbi:hypothetical protein [Acinetobacter johnsonii]|uniref:hypothetical protein n=1 Tax=Acinetobacter johnsonii TaxID=40214 RepID=UPI0039774D90